MPATVLASPRNRCGPAYLAGGGVEQDPAQLLRRSWPPGAARRRRRPTRDASSLANQGETVLAWDPATGSRSARDRLAGPPRRRNLPQQAGDKSWVAQRTGLVLDPYFSAPKMPWLRRNVTTAGVVTTSDTWLVHQLTGEFVTDASTASRSLLTDWTPGLGPRTARAVRAAGERLPAIVASDEVVGTTRRVRPDRSVGGLIVDQQAALLAQRCLAPGTAKCTFGTGAFLLANVGTSGHGPPAD